MNINYQLPKDDPLVKDIQNQTKYCFQCQTCTSGCPVFKALPDYKPSSIAQQMFQDATVPMIDGIPAFWICSGCYTCIEKCPQDVDLAHIFFHLKDWAVANNVYVPEGLIAEANTMETGITINISEGILKRREQMGLPNIPKSNTDEIKKILDKTGFQEKLDNLKVEVTQ